MDDLPEGLEGIPKSHPMTWQQVLLRELEKDSRFRIDVVTVSKHYPRTTRFERRGVTFHLIKPIGGLRAPTLFWYDTVLIGTALKRIKPDVVHAWGTERGAASVASRLGYPYLVTVQGLMSWYVKAIDADKHSKLAAALEAHVFRRAPVITTESRFAVDFIRRMTPGARVEQVEHASAWAFHTSERRPQLNPPRLLYVGTLNFRKGFDTLVAALNRVGSNVPWELIVAGSGAPEYIEAVRRESSAVVWERIRFLGEVPHTEVASHLSTATLFVFPTRADTSPNAVKESAVGGLPVIATRVGGIPDYVFPGRNGVLVEPGDPEALARAIYEALHHPLFGKGLVEPETLDRVREYLSPKVMARKFSSLYLELGGKSVRQ